jgi:glycine C-acetyltransferase
MYGTAQQYFATKLEEISQAGLTKNERVIQTPQRAHVEVPGGARVLNMCANNYLGLASHPEVVKAAHQALDRWGYGLSSVRFICGTQAVHKELEQRLSGFLGTDDTILYGSCFDANGGLFETLLEEQDAVVSDELNHASIIDGIRLAKCQRFRYRNGDMTDLQAKLEEAKTSARHILIATDGVFSMDGYIAKLREICDLAEKYGALVMVDDSHAVGFIGEHGGGTPQYCGVEGRVDILTGTLGKALGGASGGYTSGRREIIAYLRQRSRPYLFSNSVPPVVVGASLKVLDLLTQSAELQERLRDNARFFREQMTALGYQILPGEHPIVPVMIGGSKALGLDGAGDAVLAGRLAEAMLAKGVYVIAFSFPVVPKGKARIRVQLSAAHSREDLEFAVRCFAEAKKELGL